MRSKLDFVKIDNLRSLEIDSPIKIAPITILVGKNSAGKSTFARTFPLIRQSCEAKKRAPILWFGDRVDFGSFDESIKRKKVDDSESNKSEIIFTFGMSLSEDNPYWIRHFVSDERVEPVTHEANIEISIRRRQDGGCKASSLRINAYGFDVLIKTDPYDSIESITCNELSWRPEHGSVAEVTYQSILPKIRFFQKASTSPEKAQRYLEYKPFDKYIKKIIEENHSSEYADFISDAIISAPIMAVGELADHVQERLPFFGLKKNAQDSRMRGQIFELENHALVARINSFLELFDSALSQYYSGVKYIEPLRATAQRYYRKQELAVDEIDSKGENLAMFLDSLNNYQLKRFNEWTVSNFGFSARTENQGGHVTILIREGNAESESNLADIGFGFSQILPVITQVWLSTSTAVPKTGKTTCMVVEQPELHLHPAFQAKLADVFVAAITATKAKAQSFIIETHSNHIVNRIGQLISEGKLKSDLVQILIFEKDEDDSGTNIRLAGYDDRGYLKNWPIGFFEPGVD